MLNLENQETIKASLAGSGEQSKQVVCTSCDGFCPVSAKVVDGRVTKITTRDHPIFKGVLCMKGAFAPKHFSHPDRVLYPPETRRRAGQRPVGTCQLGRCHGRHCGAFAKGHR